MSKHKTTFTSLLGLAVISIPMSGAAADGLGPFKPVPPTGEEVWIAACHQAAIFTIDSVICNNGSKATFYDSSMLQRIQLIYPTMLANMTADRENQAGRANIAYAEMMRKGITPQEAMIMCRDTRIVDAYVLSRAGLEEKPNVVIKNQIAPAAPGR